MFSSIWISPVTQQDLSPTEFHCREMCREGVYMRHIILAEGLNRLWTNHFSHDSCPNMLCSHFLYVILVCLFDIDHEHHPNKSYDSNLKRNKQE